MLPDGPFSLNDHRIADLRADTDGRLHALFADDVDGDGTADRLLYAGFDGARWSAPAVIADGPGAVSVPALVVDGERVQVLWYQGGAADPLDFRDLLQRELAGGAWSPARPLHRAVDAESPLPVLATAAAADGRGHAVFAGPGGTLLHTVRGGAAWGQTIRAGDGGTDARLAAAPDGTLALATLALAIHPLMPPGTTAHNSVWVRIYQDGRWEPATAVHPEPAEHAHAPQLAWDGDGVLHAVWTQGEGGALLPTRLLHARSPDGRRWSEPVDVAPSAGKVLFSPRLAVDGDGRVHLTVARFQDGVSEPVHFHATFGGGRWTRPAQILPSAGRRDSELETAVDARGHVHAVWEDADGRYHHATLSASTPPPRPGNAEPGK
ncbi:MAG TPA: hypothetical protein VEQ60_18755 [Longimicrobium sp.]|nr:hypothetical protein [Longimicrobium sp.]